MTWLINVLSNSIRVKHNLGNQPLKTSFFWLNYFWLENSYILWGNIKIYMCMYLIGGYRGHIQACISSRECTATFWGSNRKWTDFGKILCEFLISTFKRYITKESIFYMHVCDCSYFIFLKMNTFSLLTLWNNYNSPVLTYIFPKKPLWISTLLCVRDITGWEGMLIQCRNIVVGNFHQNQVAETRSNLLLELTRHFT